MVVEKLVPASKVLSVLLPVAAASGVIYYFQRHMWPLERTLNNEWFAASETYMENMPRQGSPTPVRMNPMSAKINMHSVTY